MQPLPTDSMVLASKTKRWFASVIDYAIYSLFLYLILQWVGTPVTDVATGDTTYHLTGLPALGLLSSWFLFIPLLEGLTTQTVGKAIFNIKVIGIKGNKISLGQAVVRHLFDIVDYFPFFGLVGIIVAGNTENKQRVGDIVVKTIVVVHKVN
ncbi:MAG: RDD family protein [Flavihumibacter sp.]|nr:RDD family protein [Flavihumibacter sp.]